MAKSDHSAEDSLLRTSNLTSALSLYLFLLNSFTRTLPHLPILSLSLTHAVPISPFLKRHFTHSTTLPIKNFSA